MSLSSEHQNKILFKHGIALLYSEAGVSIEAFRNGDRINIVDSYIPYYIDDFEKDDFESRLQKSLARISQKLKPHG